MSTAKTKTSMDAVVRARRLTAVAIQKAYKEGFDNGCAHMRGTNDNTWLESQTKAIFDELSKNADQMEKALEDASDLPVSA